MGLFLLAGVQRCMRRGCDAHLEQKRLLVSVSMSRDAFFAGIAHVAGDRKDMACVEIASCGILVGFSRSRVSVVGAI